MPQKRCISPDSLEKKYYTQDFPVFRLIMFQNDVQFPGRSSRYCIVVAGSSSNFSRNSIYWYIILYSISRRQFDDDVTPSWLVQLDEVRNLEFLIPWGKKRGECNRCIWRTWSSTSGTSQVLRKSAQPPSSSIQESCSPADVLVRPDLVTCQMLHWWCFIPGIPGLLSQRVTPCYLNQSHLLNLWQ